MNIIMIVWNTKFHHLANVELKWIKTAKVVPKWPHLASCLPTVKRKSIKEKFLFAKTKEKIIRRDSMNNDVHFFMASSGLHILCPYAHLVFAFPSLKQAVNKLSLVL